MLAAARAILVEFHPIGVITTILLGGIVALFAVITLQRDYRADIFLFGSHLTLPIFLPTQ